MFKAPFIVADTEFTAWQGSQERGWSGPGEHREIVQIAAIKVSPMKVRPGLEEADAFDVFAKPVINPQLSDYFINLTHITQEQVDTHGLSLRDALARFNEFRDGLPVWSYGRDDEVIAENCELIGIPSLLDPFNDVREVVRRLGIDPGKYTSGTLHKAVGVEMRGHVHNALHDCRSILAFLRAKRAA